MKKLQTLKLFGYTLPMTSPSISVIIPVFNEERTVASIVEIVRSWGKAKEIIVVNDGSTDQTVAALKQFKDIDLITYRHNKGKGYALTCGIKRSLGEALMFLDGDVTGITHKDLDLMVAPIIQDQAEMVMGIARFWTTNLGRKAIAPFDDLTGERVVLRKNITINTLKKLEKVGYGVELLLNDLHKAKRIVSVKLPHVFILGKLEKQSIPDAMLTYIKEAGDLISQTIRQQTDGVSPQARKILMGIRKYLKQALDYFQ